MTESEKRTSRGKVEPGSSPSEQSTAEAIKRVAADQRRYLGYFITEQERAEFERKLSTLSQAAQIYMEWFGMSAWYGLDTQSLRPTIVDQIQADLQVDEETAETLFDQADQEVLQKGLVFIGIRPHFTLTSGSQNTVDEGSTTEGRHLSPVHFKVLKVMSDMSKDTEILPEPRRLLAIHIWESVATALEHLLPVEAYPGHLITVAGDENRTMPPDYAQATLRITAEELVAAGIPDDPAFLIQQLEQAIQSNYSPNTRHPFSSYMGLFAEKEKDIVQLALTVYAARPDKTQAIDITFLFREPSKGRENKLSNGIVWQDQTQANVQPLIPLRD